MSDYYKFNVRYKVSDNPEWLTFQFSSVSQLDDFLNKYVNVIKEFEFTDYPKSSNLLQIIEGYDLLVKKLIKFNIFNMTLLSCCILYIAFKI